jgi:putative endonuclease
MHVYILKCSDGSYYVGVTNDLDKRIREHAGGSDKGSYTYGRRPVELVWHTNTMGPNQAIELEKRLKKWSRKKKEALINGEWQLLKDLSACTNETNSSLFVSKTTSNQ